jgi:hypothetical protein
VHAFYSPRFSIEGEEEEGEKGEEKGEGEEEEEGQEKKRIVRKGVHSGENEVTERLYAGPRGDQST